MLTHTAGMRRLLGDTSQRVFTRWPQVFHTRVALGRNVESTRIIWTVWDLPFAKVKQNAGFPDHLTLSRLARHAAEITDPHGLDSGTWTTGK